MDVELFLHTIVERLDGQELDDADIIAWQREAERILGLAWDNGDFNLPNLVIDRPAVYSHFD